MSRNKGLTRRSRRAILWGMKTYMPSQSVKDARADAETLRLNDSRYDWCGAGALALLAGQHITAAEKIREEAHMVTDVILSLGTCQHHEPMLLEEGTFCRGCGERMPAYRGARCSDAL